MSQKGTFLPVDAYGAYGQLRSSPSTASNSAKRTDHAAEASERGGAGTVYNGGSVSEASSPLNVT